MLKCRLEEDMKVVGSASVFLSKNCYDCNVSLVYKCMK